MTTNPIPSLPPQDPESLTQIPPNSTLHDDDNPNHQQHHQSQPQSPRTRTLESPNRKSPEQLQLDQTHNQQQEYQKEDPRVLDRKGGQLVEESGMSSLSPSRLIIPPITDQEPNPRSLTSPTTLSRRPNKRKKGGPKKQKAIEKKIEALIENLKPIPFKPSKPLNFTKHEKFLKRLGLWDFVHIEFDGEIRVDLIAQLIANYESRYSKVNGFRVAVNRADLGRALKLPVKKEKGSASVLSSEAVDLDSEAVATEQSIGFIEELVSNWLLLHEDTWILPNEVVNWTKAIKDGHPEKVDWAGLVWFMVEKELNQGKQLKECYYASHLQKLIRSQREELFQEENRVEVETEVKEEEDGGEVEMWQESKGEAEVEVKEADDGGEINMGQESKVVTVLEAKKEEDDGEIKMQEKPILEPEVELKEEQVDGGEVKMGKQPTVEVGVDAEEEEDGCKVKTGKESMVELGVAVKEDEDGGKMMMGKELMVEVGVDVKADEGGSEEKVGKEPMMEAGVDVKEEVDAGEELMVEVVVEVKGGEDGGCEMKTTAVEDFLGQQLEGNDMGEEPNIELTLGKEVVEMLQEHEEVKDGDMMDVEESEADEQGQWLLDGKNSTGDHFLQRCNVEANTNMDGDEERKQEEDVDEDVVDDEEEEEAEDDEFNLMPRGNTLESDVLTGNLLQQMETTQMSFGLTETLGTSVGPSIYGNGSKREMVHEDDISHKRLRDDEPWSHRSSEFDNYMEEIEHCLGKVRMLHQTKEHAFEESNMNQQLLLSELQRRSGVIEHLQKTKREEIQKKDEEIYKLERELYLMGSLLEGYRKAAKETHKAFSEYRQQFQLPEEPLYKDVGPGGLVLSTMELEKQRLKREEEDRLSRIVIEQKVKEFENDVFSKMEAKMELHFNEVVKLCKRLMDSEHEFKLLKELTAKPVKPKIVVSPECAPVE